MTLNKHSIFNDGKRPTEERECSEHGSYTATKFIGDHWTEVPK